MRDFLPYIIAYLISLLFISAAAVVGAFFPVPAVFVAVVWLAALQVALRAALASVAAMLDSADHE